MSATRTLVALSGGVDSAVAAWLLREQGHEVECLHMSNWEDDDAYCDAATDLADARRVCDRLGLPLHRVSFAREYRESVFAAFLDEIRAGRTPNPDVLCNREIKFGSLLRYARRLGATRLATGHYARLAPTDGGALLLKAADAAKDQTYFLHAVAADDFADVDFPLGNLCKDEVRRLAGRAGLDLADKPDSTGICFIGERPFADFLARYLPDAPGPIVTDAGTTIGEHEGLHRYTLGQRKGIGIGGRQGADEHPWYVAGKRTGDNALVVVQGHNHPALLSDGLETGPMHFIGAPPAEWQHGEALRCDVRTRHRQAVQPAVLRRGDKDTARIEFDRPQRAITPGQFAVVYLGERCLGGASIENSFRGSDSVRESFGGRLKRLL